MARIDAILLLHGLGSQAEGMYSFGRLLLDQTGVEAKIVALQGEFNFGSEQAPCWGWFEPPSDDGRDFTVDDPPGFRGLDQSVLKIHEEIESLCSQGADSGAIHLVGHSQGGAAALAAALTIGKPLGSVCTIAGYLALTPRMQTMACGTAYRLHHCVSDDNVGFRWAKFAQDYIRTSGESCLVLEYPQTVSPHNIQLQQVRDMVEFLESTARRVDPPRK